MNVTDIIKNHQTFHKLFNLYQNLRLYKNLIQGDLIYLYLTFASFNEYENIYLIYVLMRGRGVDFIHLNKELFSMPKLDIFKGMV